MKLTPLDIRKQEFSRRVRGVDEEEVKAFLQMIASQWEEVQDEQRRLEDKVRDLDGKLAHYKQVEEALQEALRTARENAKDALETARQKANILVQEAEASAIHIKRDADDDRRKMKRQITRLSHRRDEIISRLRAFLMSEMEMLARFEGDDAVGFIKLMPAEERMLREANARPEPLEVEAPNEPEEPDVPEAPLPAWALFEGDEGEDAGGAADEAAPVRPASSPEHDADARALERAIKTDPTDGLDPVDQETPPHGASESEVPFASVSDPERYGERQLQEPISLAAGKSAVEMSEVEGDGSAFAESEPQTEADSPRHEEALADQPATLPPTSSNGSPDTPEGPDEEHVETETPGELVTGSTAVPGSPSDSPADAESIENARNPSSSGAPSERHQPADSEDDSDDAPGMSRWLSDRVFSAFKKGGHEPGDAPQRGTKPTDGAAETDPASKRGRKNEQQPAPATVSEDEESFTVSSEEVERIRRILKGLD